MRRTARPRNSEAGYALLFVYMMAASVAIMLYMELPRAAFEAQRDKEQLLIDRGEQYERGIQLYFRKFKTYPPSLDALDSTQNIRFIRRRYVDPMTGKADWRLIHVGAGGVLTDSLLNKGKSLAPPPSEKQTFVSEIALVGATNVTDPNQQPVNLAARKRPSDTPGAPGSPGGPSASTDPNNPNAFNNPNVPVDPNAAGIPGQQIAQGVPGQQIGQGVPGQQFAQPVSAQQIQGANGTSIVLPDGRVVPSVNGLPGGVGQMPNQNSGEAAQNNPYAQSSMPGQPGAPPTAAVNLINQLLTTPRQGGLNGGAAAQFGQTNTNTAFGTQPGAGQMQIGATVQPGATAVGATTNNTGTPITGTTGQTIGAGIAGVATKAEGEGIKIYNEHSKYKEWEFIYDLSKDTGATGVQQMQQGQNLQQQQNGLNGVGGSSPFGTSTQQSSPFGSQPTSSPLGGQTQSGFGAQTPTTTPPPTPPAPPM